MPSTQAATSTSIQNSRRERSGMSFFDVIVANLAEHHALCTSKRRQRRGSARDRRRPPVRTCPASPRQPA